MAYNTFRFFNAKTILLRRKVLVLLNHRWEEKKAHTFAEGIRLKVNGTVQLEFEHSYYDSAVHRFNHYTAMNTPPIMYRCIIIYTFEIDSEEENIFTTTNWDIRLFKIKLSMNKSEWFGRK